MRTDMIHEKGTGTINEDAVSLKGNLFGVFDGATSLNRKTYGDKTGGFLASRIASRVFLENSGPLNTLACKANSAIYDSMLEKGVDIKDKSELWSTSCAVVRITEGSVEWVQTGDSLILLIYEDGSYHIPVTDYDHDRETLSMWKSLCEKTRGKKIFDILGDQIRKVRLGMNVIYGVLNGEPAFEHFLNTGKAEKKGVRHIVLFTDGLMIPTENPKKGPDFDTFVSIYLKGGLSALRDHVRRLEENDPHCTTYPRFKRHDDIAAIAVTL